MNETDPGVPEAIPATLRFVEGHLGVERLDRVWLFPALRKGRTERGLIVVACRVHGEDRNRLYTAPYAAERAGTGLSVEPTLQEEGLASADRLGRVMEGVAQRSGLNLGDPRKVDIRGDPERFRSLLDELDAAVPEVGQP